MGVYGTIAVEIKEMGVTKMTDLLFYCYGVLTHILPFLAVLFLWKRKSPFSTPLRFVLPILFGFYVTLVFHITGAGTLWDALDLPPELWFARINPLPFHNEINIVGYALNAVMFMPFGFLVPIVCPENRKLSTVALGGLVFSLLIEASQILSLRGTDVDDLIMNTLGAVLGYCFFRLWAFFIGTRNKGFDAKEPIFWILAIFLGRFLLFNYLGLINLVYGV